jgi:hypothetical protein
MRLTCYRGEVFGSVAKARVECLSHRGCRYVGGATHRGRAAARLLVMGELDELGSMKKLVACLCVSASCTPCVPQSP